MDEVALFSRAVVEWAADGQRSKSATTSVRTIASSVTIAVLVEGESDQAALEAIADRAGRSLAAEGVAIVPMGGATSVGRFLTLLGPAGLGVRLAGLCDLREETFFHRALERAGLGAGVDRHRAEELGFFVCDEDLEAELIRALGIEAVERILHSTADLRRFRTFQNQPAQRARAIDLQLRRFLGTTSGRKAQYATLLGRELRPEQVPYPIEQLLTYVRPGRSH